MKKFHLVTFQSTANFSGDTTVFNDVTDLQPVDFIIHLRLLTEQNPKSVWNADHVLLFAIEITEEQYLKALEYEL